MSAAGVVLRVVVSFAGSEVGVPRAGLIFKLGVVARAGVRVFDHRRERSSAESAVKQTRDKLGSVGLASRGRKFAAAGGSALHKSCKLAHVRLKTGGQSLNRHADGGGVRLTEDGESDISVKAAAHCPHSNPLKFSQNRGNDLFTHSQPVTVTGSVQMHAATAADMAMR